MKALILAAGYGTRLRPYSEHTPKPLFSIAGRPLLDVIIKKLQTAGCRSVIINTHHLHHKIETFLAAQNYNLKVSTRYEPQILGTGGAIKNVADFWDNQPFMVINADIVADIDLQAVYTDHCRHRPSATLVLCNDPAFNTVSVEDDKWITGFHTQSDHPTEASAAMLTFTGIQVLEPELLDYIPDNGFYSSIDAFKKILSDGKKIGAFIAPAGSWHDIGTPQSYRQTAIAKALPEVFRLAFGTAPDNGIRLEKLKGDGSQRQWHRMKAGQQSVVMVDHGIRQTSMTSEVDSFVQLGLHLFRQGVSVPQIYFYDTFSGLVFLEDLGDISLQQTAQSMENPAAVVELYKSVIQQLIRQSRLGADNFDRSWTYQTSDYNENLILDKECRYFLEAFLNGYLGFNERFEDYQEEFSVLADKALQHPTIGFMHRDMQSRNIMIRDCDIFFIDFQGGRIGPLQYDLASLLIDPYVDLPSPSRARLLDYSMEQLAAVTELDPDKFRFCYHYCTLTRNLQILGAFAYLSRVKGKKQFEKYIPAALRTLKFNLTLRGQVVFPLLNTIVQKICRRMNIK